MKNLAALKENNIAKANTLYIALELSQGKWRIAFGNGVKQRQIVIEAGNLVKLSEEVMKAKQKLHVTADAQVISCYEAGRDGFWIHHYLTECGITNYIVDSSSIEVNRPCSPSQNGSIRCREVIKTTDSICWW
jgi:transposase